MLKGLGCEFWEGENGQFTVRPPYWRSDIRIPADVIEEIARIRGYAEIPYSRLAAALPEAMPDPLIPLKRRARQIMKGYGFTETVSYAFSSEAVLAKAVNAPLVPASLRVANPMNPEQECLRTTLRGNLLKILSENVRREEGFISIFELGRVYLRREGDLPDERETLCALMTAAGPDKRWGGRKEELDFYDAKGALEALLAELRVEAAFTEGSDPGLTPGAQAAVVAGGSQIGVIGRLHPDVAQAFDLSVPVFLFEVDVSSLVRQISPVTYHQLPRFPAVERDLALLVDRTVSYEQIAEIIGKYRLVSDITLFDVYTGKQVPEGKKSLAFSLKFRSPERTLKDAEVDGVMTAIVKDLRA